MDKFNYINRNGGEKNSVNYEITFHKWKCKFSTHLNFFLPNPKES